jgi:hypothetical protein
MAVKLMDVPGPKLIETRSTQDLILCLHADLRHAEYAREREAARSGFRDMPVFYFLNPLDSHLLDFFSRHCGRRRNTTRLGHRYYSGPRPARRGHEP